MPRFPRCLAAFALGLSLLAPAAHADDESRFSGIAQLDITNAYYFRGILNENDGIIAEPWGELYFRLYSSDDGFLRGVTAGFGVWMSIHSEETLAVNGPESLYETDYYPLVSVDFAGGVNLLTTYYFYDSPNEAWDEAVQELNFKLSWDDSELWFGVAPWMNLAIETHSTSLGEHSGTGLQLGIAPTLWESEHASIGASAEVGLAINDYYEDVDAEENTFGCANVGASLSAPITEIVSTTLGFKYYFFGDDLETVNEENGGHGVITLSVSASF